jgi:transcriptional regulator with XRE-family HTH domain
MGKKATGNKVLREVRDALEMTQEEFALEADMGDVYLSKLETGKYLIGSEVALKVYDRFKRTFRRLGYSVEDLLRSGR